jgi:predicted ATPase/class 3 adenylate cyclase
MPEDAPMRRLPVGAPTFLFTDVAGSTRLLQDLRDGYAVLLEQHRALIRTAFQRHDGIEMGTEGDSFFAVFERATQAMAAARDAQRMLADHAWPAGNEFRVRMGMHTGEADIVGDDYVGLAVHVAARVSAVAHGGQVLLSEATRHLAPDFAALDHGEHRLKDIRRPIRIFQLLDASLPSSFPPLRTLTATPNNLPAALDDFVGRDTEQADVIDALGHHRLVTLLGAGGSGKTRLATEVAAGVVADYASGVWLVELSTTDEPARIPVLIAQAVNVGGRVGSPITDTLLDELRHRELLLVIDNCEHLVEPVSAILGTLLSDCPSVRILATSRERLGVHGEFVLDVPPLELPDQPVLRTESDAVRLFVSRARGVTAGFDPDDRELELVGDICSRLDGLPLAIELAAARLRSISLDQLAGRLDDRFRLLIAQDRSVPVRQQTLEAVVAWSYDLLGSAEQAAFSRLSVFPDTFTLDAAEAVAAGDPVPAADVLDVVAALIDRSLLSTVATPAGDLRYQMLETLRQYGRARLGEAGETARWRDAMLSWALTNVDALERVMRTPRQDSALLAVRHEHANMREAMEWAIERGDALSALRIVGAVPLGLPSERLTLIDELLGRLPQAPAAVVGQARLTATNLSMEKGDFAGALEAGRAAERAFETDSDAHHAAWARYFQVLAAWGCGLDSEVDDLCDRLLIEFRTLDEPLGIAYVLWMASLRLPDQARAAKLGDEACELFRAVGADFGLAHALEGRALLALRAGDYTLAITLVEESLTLFRASGNAGCTAHCMEAVAACLAEFGDLPAVAELAAAADAFRQNTVMPTAPGSCVATSRCWRRWWAPTSPPSKRPRRGAARTHSGPAPNAPPRFSPIAWNPSTADVGAEGLELPSSAL